MLPSLPDALVVLTGPKLRAAGVVVRHQLIDAVWVEEADRTIGETAAMALMGARQGSVSGYRLENPRLGEALTMLWRCPAVYREMPASWVNTDSLLMDLEGRNGDAAILISGGVHGVALVAGGELVGVYTETERQPIASLERLAALLRAPGARVTLRQNPEERPVDQMPETAYHAFVEAAGELPAPFREPSAARPAAVRNGIEPSTPTRRREHLGTGRPLRARSRGRRRSPRPGPPHRSRGPRPGTPRPSRGPRPGTPRRRRRPPQSRRGPAPRRRPDVPSAPAEPAAPHSSTASGGPDLRADAAASSVPFLASIPGEPAPPIEPAGPAAPTGEPAAAPEAALWSPSPLADFDEVGPSLAPWSGVYQAPPAAVQGPSGPAQFADFAASQGMDDLAAPTPGPDFDTVKADLIQIGALWLGTDGVGPVAEMLQRARPTIADVMAAIELDQERRAPRVRAIGGPGDGAGDVLPRRRVPERALIR